ncbi:MAG: GNAT family N-acetyltransferase [Alphaproteobacteria bacterium]|nr:GNAT family N-acetyltransferase [Alphaproteobacteria bacterium]
MTTSIKIRPIEPNDFPDWLPLWDGNNMNNRNKKVTTETWSRLIDPSSQINGLAAFQNKVMVGLVHYVLHQTTGYIEPVCYMQDVYVTTEHRQKGIGQAMVERVIKIGQKEKWARIQWFAENNNAAAQELYKNIGIKLDFSLHIFPLKT